MWYWAVAMDSLCGKEGGDRERRETHAEREREAFFFLQTLEVSLTFSTQAQRQRTPPVKPTYTYAPTHTHTHTNTCHSAENSRKQFRLLDTHKQENTETFFSLFFNRRKGMQVLIYKQLDTNTKITMPKEEKTMTDGVSWTIWLSSILCHTHLWQIECIPVSWRSESKSQYGHLGQEVASHSRCACLQIQLEWVYISICSAHKDGHHFMNFQKILHL